MRKLGDTPFKQLGWLIILLMIVAFVGFGPGYFHRLGSEGGEISMYFHFHAFSMVIWLFLTLTQVISVRRGNYQIHKFIGKSTFVLFPMVIISTLFLIHYQLRNAEAIYGADFFIPMKDVITMSAGYILGIVFSARPAFHSRFMIATLIPLIEPSLVRALIHTLPEKLASYAYPATVLTIDALLLILVVMDFRRKHLKWVFIGLFLVILLGQCIIFSGAAESSLIVGVAKWFSDLNLT